MSKSIDRESDIVKVKYLLIMILMLVLSSANVDTASKEIDGKDGVPTDSRKLPLKNVEIVKDLNDGAPQSAPTPKDSRSTTRNRHVLSSGGAIRQIGPFDINLSVGQPVVGSSDLGPFKVESGGMDTPESPPTCGDANASGDIDIDDIMYLAIYIFLGGPPPAPAEIGNVNCVEETDIDDVMFLINFVFLGGYSPCDPDGDGIPDC